MKLNTRRRPQQQRRFAQLMIATLRRKGEKRQVRYDSGNFCLRIDEGKEGKVILHLHNAYDEWRAAPPVEKPDVLNAYADSRTPFLPADFSAVRPNLVPMVLPRYCFTEWFHAADGIGPDVSATWHKPIAEHLAVGLAHETPDLLSQFNDAQLRDWGVSPEDAYAIACDN